MVLLLRRSEVEGLLDLDAAIEVARAAALEEIAGTVIRMAPFGGQGGKRPIVRIVGGGLFGLGRFGLRAGDLVTLYDADTTKALAVMNLSTGDTRLAASVALGAQYLARPDAKRVALVGSGGVAFNTLKGLAHVRSLEHVGVWSRTPEHREAFAVRAAEAFDVPVTPFDDPDAMFGDADIVAAATNAHVPLVRFEQLQPGTHVVTSGLNHELDISLYREADQIVANSKQQAIDGAIPANTPGLVTGGPLYDLFCEGRSQDCVVDIGAIIAGQVPARSGPKDINVYMESRGGVGDAALAARVYDLARERGIGTDVDMS